MHTPTRLIRNLHFLSMASMLLLLVIPLAATQDAETGRPADVETLRLNKSGGDIAITCTDGTGPEFSMARNNLATFSDPASLVLNSGAACNFTDSGELSLPNTRFYFLADSKAPPRVMDASPAVVSLPATVAIKGVALRTATVTAPDGKTVTPTANTATQITLDFAITEITSGPLQVITPNGGTYTDPLNIFLYNPSVNNNLYDIALYQDAANTTRRILASARETTTNKIYIINPPALTVTSLTLTPSLAYPMGLTLGTLQLGADAGKTYLFYGSGISASSGTSAIVKLDFLAATPTQSAFRSLSIAGDIFSVRALSFFPRISSLTDPRLVFAYDPSSTNKEIRKAPEDTTVPVSTYVTTFSPGANTSTKNFPGGLSVRHPTSDPLSRATFYVTNGLGVTTSLSRLEFRRNSGINGSTGLWTSPFDPAKRPITNGAQIAPEAFGSEHVYLADRGNLAATPAQPARVHKVNASLCGTTNPQPPNQVFDCVADPSLAFVSSFDYNGKFLDVRGIAIEMGKDVTSGGNYSYSKFLYLVNKLPAGFPVTGYGISKVRALREIPVRVMIGQHAGGKFTKAKNPNKDVPMSDIIAWVNANIARVNKNLYPAGYQLKFDPVTDLILNVVDNFDVTTYAYTTADASGNCPADLQSLAINGGADAKKVNIFVVHGIKKPDGTPSTSNGQFKRLNNTCATTNVNHVMLMNFTASAFTTPSPGAYNDPASDAVISHELFHKLTNNAIGGGGYGYDATGHRALVGGVCVNDHLMCPDDHLTHMSLQVSGASANDRDDDLANVTGRDTELVLPDFGILP